MTDPLVTRAVGRSTVVLAYLAALAIAGRPAWLAVLLGVALVLVWASPLLMTRRRPLWARHGLSGESRVTMRDDVDPG
ncbi:hypothetical protein GCM10010531_33040 [Blastococcus jejuensis]|uniref:Uncharacterized protein n=1 Tax=Blastococcus jejuensis TaxID=351224 RepID=A0ABP6PHC9_9ACTN